jgi:lysophospholipase L1-like esterase
VRLDLRRDRARFADELDRLVAPLARPDVTLVLATLPDLTACSALRRRVETTREHSFWSFDRIHPSAEGHRAIAASVAELVGYAGRDNGARRRLERRRCAAPARWRGWVRYGLRV